MVCGKNVKFDDEKILIRELKKQNEKAFDYFVRKYQNLVISYISTIINNYEESWNISQEVFISVFRNINTFLENSSLKTWLLKIAHNYALNKIRYMTVRQFKNHDSVDDIKEKYPNFEIETEDNPLEKLNKKELETLMEKALSLLDEEEKELILLKFINELSYEEIVEITGCNIGTIKSKLFRIKTKLKENYLSLGGNYE